MPVNHVSEAVVEWRNRQPQCNTFANYFDGRHELKFVTPDWSSKYAKEVLRGAVLSIRENLCPAVVTSFTDAIRVASWGGEQDTTDATNFGLPRLLGFTKRESWRQGDAYTLVWPGPDGKPRPSFQRARLIVPHVDELNPDVLDRAAKIWRDPASKRGRCNLYYADVLERWETVNPLPTSGSLDDSWSSSSMPDDPTAWRPCTDEDGDIVRHSFGAVPVCWWKLDADEPTGHGVSILNDAIPIQDGLNSSLANMIVNQESYSRPFWYLLNFREDQAPANPFLAAAQATSLAGAITNSGSSDSYQSDGRGFDRTRQSIVTHSGPGPMGQLDPPDATHLLEIQEAFKIKVCSVVGIPPYLMQAEIGNVPSGAALRTLSERRTARVKAWEDDNQPVLRGLKQLLGMSDDPVTWAPALTMDESEVWEIARTKKDLGYSFEDILRGVGETDIEGILERAQQAAQGDAARMAQAFLDGRGAGSYAG